ncbi:PREDICTED: tyrosine-protein phosphatase non-receptor type 1-like [Acropora digitifera]|uniref:tyrosine-protein phosphatase non-receptor type 1-like n=1 Tax=Acropora digitifera TaxID=70779 RepID=UPI00077A522F|nr:PREDICTED: tyrosine-protein phosphatase non-receptor type 1-like [Acropora digitifera]
MLAELQELDESKGWQRLFQRLNWEASQKAGSLTAARLPENRQLNRYRDVLPYDHSRVILKDGPPDYINANLVEISRLNRRYILTQVCLTGEKRCIYHFHYQTWPDFGVPTSPATFLAFLFEVRQKGVLSPDVGPSVIHCSAGIGRSGTFVMVDSILKEIESTGDMEQISITDVLLEIRQYRVGLIQTPDQLRFTYLAILEGVKVLMPEIYQKATENHWKANEERENEKENLGEVTTGDAKSEEDSGDETPPPVPERRRPEDAASTADEPRAKIIRLSEDEPKADSVVFTESSEGSDEIIDLSSRSDSEQSGHSAGEEIESSQVSTKEDIKKGNEIPSGQTGSLQAEEEDKVAVHQVNNDSTEVEKTSEQGEGELMKNKAEKQETSEVILDTGTGPQETSEAIKVEGESEFILTANETTRTERY